MTKTQSINRPIQRREKPSEAESRTGQMIRFINTVEAGEVDETKTTLESRHGKKVHAGNSQLED